MAKKIVDRGRVRITRPFVVYVEPAPDVPGVWCASIVGADGMDYVTQADSPEGAVFMAWDALCLATGRCGLDHEDHDLSVEAELADGSSAVGCSRCDTKVRADLVVTIDEELP